MKLSHLPHRRLFLAACVAAGIASAARPGHSAEIEAHRPRWAPDPRPWADFQAAKDAAEKHESTPAGVEATMIGMLGPLPWRFVDSPWGACVVTKLAPMGEPSDERETTGVWAVIRYVTGTEQTGAVLYQVGKLRLTLGKRAQIMMDAWMLSDLEGSKADTYELVTMRYELLDEVPVLKHATINCDRYSGAIDAMIAEIEGKLATDIVPPFVLMPGVTA